MHTFARLLIQSVCNSQKHLHVVRMFTRTYVYVLETMWLIFPEAAAANWEFGSTDK